MKPLFAGVPRPLLFGHRGYSSVAPENTMEAFDLCVGRGIPGAELDVHLCKSGELVIIHDHELQRLAGIDAVVEDSTYAELRQLDVGSHKDPRFAGARIPLLFPSLFPTSRAEPLLRRWTESPGNQGYRDCPEDLGIDPIQWS